jgi:predicted nucleotidyltransferase
MLPADYQRALDRFSSKLPSLLGENLYSSVLYGSAVRGNVVADVSDINILVVLNVSTPQAHAAIAECLDSKIKIDLFVIGRIGMERSFAAFPLKFRSIKRNYRVLHGVDVMEAFSVTERKLRFFCEQGVRNLCLRCVHTYIEHGNNRKRYLKYLLTVYTPVFTEISEILRLEDQDVPNDYAQRIPLIESYFSLDGAILGKLLEFKQTPKSFYATSPQAIHTGLFGLLNGVVQWLEARWPAEP